jgi:hypothetical protein
VLEVSILLTRLQFLPMADADKARSAELLNSEYSCQPTWPQLQKGYRSSAKLASVAMACVLPARLLHSRNSHRRKFRQRFDRCAVPGSERSVIRSRDSTAPIGCYRNGPDHARMAFECADRLAAVQVSESQRSDNRGPTRRGAHRALPLRH